MRLPAVRFLPFPPSPSSVARKANSLRLQSAKQTQPRTARAHAHTRARVGAERVLHVAQKLVPNYSDFLINVSADDDGACGSSFLSLFFPLLHTYAQLGGERSYSWLRLWVRWYRSKTLLTDNSLSGCAATLMQQNVCACLIRLLYGYQLVLNDVKSNSEKGKNSWKKIERALTIELQISYSEHWCQQQRWPWNWQRDRSEIRSKKGEGKETKRNAEKRAAVFLFRKGEESERVISRACIFCSTRNLRNEYL